MVRALFGGMFVFIFSLAFLAFYIYLMVLFIKLANRGIKALDIYIYKNTSRNYYNPQSYNGDRSVNSQYSNENKQNNDQEHHDNQN